MEFIELNNPFPADLSLVTNRSPGLHVSQIYNDLEEILFPIRKTDNPLWCQVGFLYERLLELAFKDALGVRPAEVECDGIIGSPDGIDYENNWIEEYKCSFKSAKRTVETMWKWQVQTMAYCHMCKLNVVKFRVLYLVGYYRGEGPIYRETLVVYTNTEIQQNWTMILDHGRSKGWLK